VKILGIMGSPRIGSNTDLLLDEALKGAQSQGAAVEKIIVARLKLSPCQECYKCAEDGSCRIKDDMGDIYPKLLDAERIIFASPMFFYSITAQAKALVDRTQALWARKHILGQSPPNSNRKGAFIAVGATKGKELFTGSILTVKYFFEVIGVKYVDELLIRGIDEEGEIEGHPTALVDAFELGKRLAEE